MALPPIVKLSTELRLVSPHDPAIDREATGRLALQGDPERLSRLREIARGDDEHLDDELAHDPNVIGAAAINAYASGEDRSIDNLAFRAGEQPTIFIVRGLGTDEREVCEMIGGPSPAPSDDALNAMHRSIGLLRLALVRIEGWEGWDDKARERRYDHTVWTTRAALKIPALVRMFLGAAVVELSQVTEKKSDSSG